MEPQATKSEAEALAGSVASAINGFAISGLPTAEACLDPSFEFGDLAGSKLYVIPTGISRQFKARNLMQKGTDFDVLLISGGALADGLQKIEALADRLAWATFTGARVMETRQEPLYDQQQWRDNKLFVAVVAITVVAIK